MLVKRNITIANSWTAANPYNNDKKVIVLHLLLAEAKKKNNTKRENPKDIDVVMAVYHLIEYSDNYSKASGNWQ